MEPLGTIDLERILSEIEIVTEERLLSTVSKVRIRTVGRQLKAGAFAQSLYTAGYSTCIVTGVLEGASLWPKNLCSTELIYK